MDCAVKYPAVWKELRNARLMVKRAEFAEVFSLDDYTAAMERLRKAESCAQAAGFIVKSRPGSVVSR